jgi:hypothetical protein
MLRRLAIAVALCSTVGCASGGAATEAAAPAPPPAAAPAAAPRTEAQVLEAVSAFAAAVKDQADDALPARDSAAFVAPPSEAEIAWLNDRELPLERRLDSAMKLSESCRAIARRYAARDVARGAADPARAADSPEAMLWAATIVRQLGRVSVVMLDEVVPTLSTTDPGYAIRMQGLDQMRDGAVTMLRGTFITLAARRASAADRQIVTSAWRAHAARYTQLWGAERCRQVLAVVRPVLDSETDAALRDDLTALAAEVETCASAP